MIVIQSDSEESQVGVFFNFNNMKTLGNHNYYTYILTNKSKTVLYTGVTNNLEDRLYFHNNPEPFSKAFTAKYKCYYLLYHQHFFEINEAIKREKEIKGWSRSKKENLITSFNPDWKFLNDEIREILQSFVLLNDKKDNRMSFRAKRRISK